MFLESKDHRALASYALLLNNIDSNRSFIGQFVPFVFAVLKDREDKKIEPFQISSLIKEQFGFEIPRLAALSIINYAKKQGLIIRGVDKQFYPTQEALDSTHIADISKNLQCKQDIIIQDFITYINEAFHKALPVEEAREQFSLFFQKNALPFLLTQDAQGSELRIVKAPNDRLYDFYKYITHLDATKNTDFLKHITDIAFGYILASLILGEGEDNALTPQLKGLQIFLDTPIIIRLLGFEGKERQEAQQELISMLRKEGAVLLLLQHTYKETMNILVDVAQKISATPTDAPFIGRTLSYCMYLGLSKADIESSIASFSSFLKANDISIVDTTYTISHNQQYNIDHNKLFQTIKDTYRESSSPEVVQNRENAIELDVNSIAEVCCRRKNVPATEVSKSISFLLTSNTGLALASKKFIASETSQHRLIPPCLTDSFITTLLWSKSPSAVYQLNEKKMISDCYAALVPDESILKKFLARVERLRKDNKISPEMYQLRMYKVTQDLLYTKDHEGELTEDVSDDTIIEILSEVQYQAEKKAQAAYKQKELELKQQLREKEQQINLVKQQKQVSDDKLVQEQQGKMLMEEKRRKELKRRQQLITKISRFVFAMSLFVGALLIIYIFVFGNKFRSCLDFVSVVLGGSLLGGAKAIQKRTYQKLYTIWIDKDCLL